MSLATFPTPAKCLSASINIGAANAQEFQAQRLKITAASSQHSAGFQATPEAWHHIPCNRQSNRARSSQNFCQKLAQPTIKCRSAHAASAFASGIQTDDVKTTSSGSRIVLHVGDMVELYCRLLSAGRESICDLVGTSMAAGSSKGGHESDSGFEVLCGGAVPGETLLARVSQVRKGSATAEKLATLMPPPDALVPRCAHFGTCGGCTLQTLFYPGQLAAKQAHVAHVLGVMIGIPDLEQRLRPIVPCEQTYQYRNKMEFTYSPRTWSVPQQGDHSRMDLVEMSEGRTLPVPTLGLLRPYHSDQALPIQDCCLQGDTANDIMRLLATAIQEAQLLPLVAGKGKQPETGFLQRIGIRSATIGAPPDAEPDHQAVRDDSSSSSSSSSKDSGDSINKDAGASLRDLAQPQVQPEDAHEVQRQRQPQQQQQQQRPEQQQQRQRQQQQQFMVHFVTAPAADAATKLAPVIAMLLQRCPSVVSVVRTDATGSVGDGRSSSTRGPGVGTVGTNNNSSSAGSLKRSAKRVSKAVKAAERRARRGTAATYQVLYGSSALRHHVGGHVFDVSASAFFQTNTAQAAVLQRLVVEAAGLRDGCLDVVVDLFCGVAFFAVTLAPLALSVHGLEISTSAVADAKANANANDITNAHFYEADLNGCTPSVSDGIPEPDVVIADPGRAGMSTKLLMWLRGCSARRIVYVSCNPATQARDIATLVRRNRDDRKSAGEQSPHTDWQLQWLQPVDMFPQTNHVETVAVLDRMN